MKLRRQYQLYITKEDQQRMAAMKEEFERLIFSKFFQVEATKPGTVKLDRRKPTRRKMTKNGKA